MLLDANDDANLTNYHHLLSEKPRIAIGIYWMMVIVSTHPIASTSPIRIIRFLPWCIVHLPIDSSTSSSPANSCRTISSWRNFIFKTSSYRRNLISKTSSCRRNIISKISSCRRNLISKISSCRRNLISQTSMCRRIRASRIFLPSMTTNLLRRHCLTTNSSSAAVASVPWISPLQILRKEPDLPPQSTSNVDSSDHNRWRRSYILHSTAIQMITTSRDAQLALDIFNHAGSQSGFNHNNETYAAILNRLARSQKFLAIDALLVRMRQEPCRFNEAVILNLMPYFSRASLCDKTLDLFHAIPSLARSKPSMKAFSTCLNNLVVHGRFDLAERLISDADKKYNLTPNVCIYNILIKHHCKVGDLDSGFAVLDSIRDSQDFPNLITYSTLISGLCSSGRLKDAFKVFEEMNERDKITPDAMIYNILINGFCRNSMTDKAATMLGFMRANGCEPNIVNYSTLMIGYCRENRYDKALAVFNSIPTHNLKPTRFATQL
ncbi:hypothetical protein ZOSMA_8G00530 [Zostera marina]|uniref:Pentatricopeptide repeat-containing protein n=1 Tax=Zostera marina TaxID=29655 RepID=A0A0K9NJG2_ZOSMR|nr:hypothetical protein ZOSMA_8G00530 [Zostera marina]